MFEASPALIEWLRQCWPGPLVRESFWIFAFAETMHFVGLSLLFGSMLFVDLRLMGFYKQLPVRAALAFLPFALVGFCINAASGWVLFSSAPANYLGNPAFYLKMALILLAGLNALAFTFFEHSKAVLLGPGEDTPATAKILAGASLLLWLAILLVGRWLPLFTVGTN